MSSSKRSVAAAAAALNNSSGAVDYEGLRKKINVTESNGEISMDMAETNKLREMLGLKPLRTDTGNDGSGKSAEVQAVENFAEKKAGEDKERELAEIQVRLERARRQRKLKETMAGSTIAEEQVAAAGGEGSSSSSSSSSSSGGGGGDDDAAGGEVKAKPLSAADWVRKSRASGSGTKRKIGSGVGASSASSNKTVAKLQAEKRRRLLEEQEEGYGSQHLAGMKVGHSLSDMVSSGDGIHDEGMVLTIQDSSVLNESGDGLNDDGDQLVNVNLLDAERTKELHKIKARAKLPVYSGGVHDDEFENEETAAAAARAHAAGQRTKKLLSHYDEEEGKSGGLVLGANGSIAGLPASSMDLDEDGGSGGVASALSLRVKKTTASDYLTTDEMNAMNKKKPKKMRKKKKKDGAAGGSGGKKAFRKKAETGGGYDEDEDEGEDDFGSRRRPNRGGGGRDEPAATAAADKRKAFDAAKATQAAALAKATAEEEERASARAAAAKRAASAASEEAPTAGGGGGGEDDAALLDSDLSVSLARVRRLAQLRDASDPKRRNDELVSNFARQKAQERAASPPPPPSLMSDEQGAGVGGGDGDGEGGASAASVIAKDDGKIIFTSMHEFSSRLDATLTERSEGDSSKARARKAAAAAAAAADAASESSSESLTAVGGRSADVADIGLSSSSSSSSSSSYVGAEEAEGGDRSPLAREDGANGDNGDAGDMMDEDGGGGEGHGSGDSQMGFMHRQPLAESGLAATIGLLASAGDLNTGAREEAQVGRAKDERRFHLEEGGGGAGGNGKYDRFKNIKIEHRDSDGRLLTRKEAYRQMSYKFHGHGPKQKKTEKRQQQLAELDQTTGGAQDFGTSAVLQRALAASGSAYMPISGGAASFAARQERYLEGRGLADEKTVDVRKR